MNKYRVSVIDFIDRITIVDRLFDRKEDADIEYQFWLNHPEYRSEFFRVELTEEVQE